MEFIGPGFDWEDVTASSNFTAFQDDDYRSKSLVELEDLFPALGIPQAAYEHVARADRDISLGVPPHSQFGICSERSLCYSDAWVSASHNTPCEDMTGRYRD